MALQETKNKINELCLELSLAHSSSLRAKKQSLIYPHPMNNNLIQRLWRSIRGLKAFMIPIRKVCHEGSCIFHSQMIPYVGWEEQQEYELLRRKEVSQHGAVCNHERALITALFLRATKI